MKISICIATWSRKSKLKKILELLENQSFSRNDYEIIVVDSKSLDGTKGMVNELCRVYGNIKYIGDSENVLATKRNIGIEYASSEIIVLMDDDVYPSYNFILSHYSANKENYDTFYCGQIRFPNNLCQKSNYYRFRNEQHLNRQDSNKDLPFNKIVVMNMSFRKEFIKNTGKFDDRFIGYGCEDIEFGYRIIQKGYKLKYLETALAIHWDDCSDISSYGKKIYKSGLYGHRVLKRTCPIILSVLYKKKMIIGYILSNILVYHLLKIFLEMTDNNQYMYSYYIYKAFLYSCTFRGRRDQKRVPGLDYYDIVNGW